MCLAAAAIPIASLAISAVSTVGSLAMGAAQMSAQAAQAQAQMQLQAQQAERQMQMQRQQQMEQRRAQRQTQILQQQQQYSQQVQQQRQSQDNYNLSVANSNAQIANQYAQQRRQVQAERANIYSKYVADLKGYQRSKEGAEEQSRYNNEAANRMYVQEQAKLNEAEQKAKFAQQDALAKSIGAKGAILATGRTGQSIGLLINDVERQKGFAYAQSLATMDSKRAQTATNIEMAYVQNQSANARAESQVGWRPDQPYMPEMPGTPEFLDPLADGYFDSPAIGVPG